MNDDQAPVTVGADDAFHSQVIPESIHGTAGSSSDVEPITPPTHDLTSLPDALTQVQPIPDPITDEGTTPRSVDQGIEHASVGRDVFQVGRDLTVNHYGPDLAELQALRLFSESQREKMTDDYLHQAVKQAEVTFRMSVLFITAGGLVILAAVVLGLVHPSTPHSVSYVSALAGLLIGSGGGAFAIRADKSRKHLAEAMKQIDAEVQAERHFAQQAWRFTQATKAISDIRDPNTNDHARVELARMILSDPQTITWQSLKSSTPEDRQPAVQEGDDQIEEHSARTSRRSRRKS